jgi:hypothetical protein
VDSNGNATRSRLGKRPRRDFDTRTAQRGAISPACHRQPQIRGRRCGILLEGRVLFRTNEVRFAQTRRKLLKRDCDLCCVIRFPPGHLRFCDRRRQDHLRGGPSEKAQYYDLSSVKDGNKSQVTADKLEELFSFLPARGDSELSWLVSCGEIDGGNYDLKVVNPSRKRDDDVRAPGEFIDIIEAKGREVAAAATALRNSGENLLGESRSGV